MLEFIHFPAAEIRGGIRTIELLRERANNDDARSIRKLREFLEMFVDMMPCAAPL
jgi:hypothetical protein